MKRLIIIMCVMVLVSCSDGNVAETEPDGRINMRTYMDTLSYTIKIFTVDGHDYITFRGPDSISALHSESCPCKKLIIE